MLHLVLVPLWLIFHSQYNGQNSDLSPLNRLKGIITGYSRYHFTYTKYTENTHLDRTGKSHLIDVHVFWYRCPRGRSESRHYIYHSGWKASLSRKKWISGWPYWFIIDVIFSRRPVLHFQDKFSSYSWCNIRALVISFAWI